MDSPQNAPLRNTNSIRYNSDKGLWQERTLRFDAAPLKPGDNELTFTVPGGENRKNHGETTLVMG